MGAIWYKDVSLDTLRAHLGVNAEISNILNLLGVEITDIGDDFLEGRMPVDERTRQIHGILHGGATCVLAETVASIASLLCVDLEKQYAVGSVIIANHLRPALSGFVHATASSVHLGRTKHVWDIPVRDDEGRLIAKCELTCAVTDKA